MIKLKCSNDDDSLIVASGSLSDLYIINYKEGKVIKILKGHLNGSIRALSQLFLKEYFNMTLIISGGDDSMIHIWDLHKTQILFTLKGHFSFIRTVLQHESETLISCSDDTTIKLWDIKNKSEIKTLKFHNEPVNSLIKLNWKKDDQTFVTADDKSKIIIWNLDSENILICFDSNNNFLLTLKQIFISPELTIISSGSFGSTLKFWDIEKGKCVYSFFNHEYPVESIVQINSFNSKFSFLVYSADKIIIKLITVKIS